MSDKKKQAKTEEAIMSEDEEVLEAVVEDKNAEAFPDIEELLEEVTQLRTQNNELQDQFTRAKAETENTRRISVKEVEKARKFSLELFAKELLLVKDSLDQAAQVELDQDANAQIIEQMADGLSLTLKQLESIFERFKITAISPEAGDALDPELHQAMTKQPSGEVDANNVVTTIQVGYMLNERLLRPAMVIVSSGSGSS